MDSYNEAFVIPPGCAIQFRFRNVHYPMRNGIVKIEVTGWKTIGVTV